MSKIKEKILEETDISEDSLDKKIEEKLDQLSGLISEEGAAHIVANELDVKLTQSTGRLEIDNIVSGMRDVEVIGKAYKVFDINEFDKNGRSGKVGNFILADNTGTIRIVLWNDQADLIENISEGDTVMIESGYVRENQNRPEIHLNEKSDLTVNPPDVSVDVELDDIGPARKKVEDLEKEDDNVEVLATIVQVFEPRFFEVCPGCGSRARESGDSYECETHGTVNDPDYSYVMNLFLDDGTDNIRAVLWRNSVQRLLGLDDEEVKEFREAPVEFEEEKNDLLGNIVRVRGRVQYNDAFDRLELVANFIERNPDPEKEMNKLKEQADEDVEVEETPEPEVQPEPEESEEDKGESDEEKGESKDEEETDDEESDEDVEKEKKAMVSDEAMEEGMMDEDVGEEEIGDEDIPSIDEL